MRNSEAEDKICVFGFDLEYGVALVLRVESRDVLGEMNEWDPTGIMRVNSWDCECEQGHVMGIALGQMGIIYHYHYVCSPQNPQS